MISGKKKSESYRKVKKLLEGNNIEDFQIGRAILLSKFAEFTPKQFSALYSQYNKGFMTLEYDDEIDIDILYDMEEITLTELQEILYDKRQKEIRANKRRNIKKNQPI